MAKLTSINLPEVAKKPSKQSIPTVTVPGDIVVQYNAARDQKDRAEEAIKDLSPYLIEAGLAAVFKHNTAHANNPKAIVSSVNLQSEPSESNGEVETCLFTWTKKDTRNDAEQAIKQFERVRTVDGKKVNVNDYIAWSVVATFDTSVFAVDGKFSTERYDAFTKALEQVSERFGVTNPLSCGKVLKPVPDFHEKRWSAFDAETNKELQTVLPTQCNLKPVRYA